MRRLGVVLVLLLWASTAGAQTTVLGTNSVMAVSNASSTGTTLNLLAKITSSGAVIATTSDTTIPLYIVTFGAGTSGSAILNLSGTAPCVMDANASNTAGQYVVASTGTNGRCHAQSSPPANGMVIGTMVDNSTTTGSTALVNSQNIAFVPGSGGSGTGTVNSGTAERLAYYPTGGDGTTVDDLAAAPTSGRALKGNGTQWVTSSVNMGGAGSCTNQAVTAVGADTAPTCTTLTSAYVNNSIALTGTDIDTSSQVTGVSVAFALKGDLTPTGLSGDINDYNPASLATASVLRLDPGAANRNWTGLAGGADGRLITVCNVGASNAVVMRDQSASSAAANRFALNGDVWLTPAMCTELLYDNTTQRWRGLNNAVLDAYAMRPCQWAVGDPGANSAPLESDQDSPSMCANVYGKPWKITAFACKADAGSPTVTPILTGGSATSILTGACTCGTSWTSCTLNGTPTLNSFSADGATCSSTPCTLDGNITTAGGTAKLIHFSFIGSLQR